MCRRAPGARLGSPVPSPSVPPTRGYAQIHSDSKTYDQQQQRQQPPRPASPSLEHKRLQAARGSYDPIRHEYVAAPSAEYADRKQREFERAHCLTGSAMRRVEPRSDGLDPIRWEQRAGGRGGWVFRGGEQPGEA